MILGIDIDNTITHTTEMILHYAQIFGREQGLNTVADLRYYYLEDILGWDKRVADDFLKTIIWAGSIPICSPRSKPWKSSGN
jgi:hypothetical protein